MPIPHVIHQMWLDRIDPVGGPPLDRFPIYKEYMESWKIHNPTWTYRLWNKNDIMTLWADKRAARWASLPGKMKHLIELCDISRYLIELLEGGFYADLDFLNKRSLDEAVEGKEILLVGEPEEHTKYTPLGPGSYNVVNPISNGIMASAPGHPFWAAVLDYILDNYESNLRKSKMAIETTGPYMLFHVWSKDEWSHLNVESACSFIYYSLYGVSTHCGGKNPYTVTKWNEGTGWPAEYDQTTTNTAIMIAIIAILLLAPLLLLWTFNRRRL